MWLILVLQKFPLTPKLNLSSIKDYSFCLWNALHMHKGRTVAWCLCRTAGARHTTLTHLPHASHPCTGYMPFPCHPSPAIYQPHTTTCLPSGVLCITPQMRTRHQMGTPRKSTKPSPNLSGPRPSHSQENMLPSSCPISYSPLQVQPSRVMTCRQIPQGFTFLKVFTLKW